MVKIVFLLFSIFDIVAISFLETMVAKPYHNAPIASLGGETLAKADTIQIPLYKGGYTCGDTLLGPFFVIYARYVT